MGLSTAERRSPHRSEERPASEGLRLRKPRASDLPIFFDQQREPEANRMAAFPPRENEAFLAHWWKILADETVLIRTIVFEGAVAGNVVSFMRGDTREVGYWLGREFWGRGIATDALTRFLRIEKRRPLYAGVARSNSGSIRVLEKCGFTPCGEEGEQRVFRLA
jgi:RimJ/RimL family protein N-acetyltransferase